jgi:hypothetical protein
MSSLIMLVKDSRLSFSQTPEVRNIRPDARSDHA